MARIVVMEPCEFEMLSMEVVRQGLVLVLAAMVNDRRVMLSMPCGRQLVQMLHLAGMRDVLLVRPAVRLRGQRMLPVAGLRDRDIVRVGAVALCLGDRRLMLLAGLCGGHGQIVPVRGFVREGALLRQGGFVQAPFVPGASDCLLVAMNGGGGRFAAAALDAAGALLQRMPLLVVLLRDLVRPARQRLDGVRAIPSTHQCDRHYRRVRTLFGLRRVVREIIRSVYSTKPDEIRANPTRAPALKAHLQPAVPLCGHNDLRAVLTHSQSLLCGGWPDADADTVSLNRARSAHGNRNMNGPGSVRNSELSAIPEDVGRLHVVCGEDVLPGDMIPPAKHVDGFAVLYCVDVRCECRQTCCPGKKCCGGCRKARVRLK